MGRAEDGALHRISARRRGLPQLMQTSPRQPRFRAPRTDTIPQTVTAPDTDGLRRIARQHMRDVGLTLCAANFLFLLSLHIDSLPIATLGLMLTAALLMARAILHYGMKLNRTQREIWSMNRFAGEEAANPARSKAENYSEVSGAVKPADFGNQGERSAKWLWHMRRSFRSGVRFILACLFVASLILFGPLIFGRSLSQGEALALVAAGFLTGSGLFLATAYMVVSYIMHPRAFVDDFRAKRPGATEADAQSAYAAVDRFRFG